MNASGVGLTESAVGNPYMFTGRRWDTETDTYYYRFRNYCPMLGRFMQNDPLGYVDGMNQYAYCGNNPGNYIDPMGLFWANGGGFGDSRDYVAFGVSFGDVADFWGDVFNSIGQSASNYSDKLVKEAQQLYDEAELAVANGYIAATDYALEKIEPLLPPEGGSYAFGPGITAQCGPFAIMGGFQVVWDRHNIGLFFHGGGGGGCSGYYIAGGADVSYYGNSVQELSAASGDDYLTTGGTFGPIGAEVYIDGSGDVSGATISGGITSGIPFGVYGVTETSGTVITGGW
ncbi:MAG: RHS repeat-associated core domain-containing protein [Phycisphaerae bacterium]|nr:RHS repeat-associated core domain-containing protein [Phycisphaerae bacterium]